MPIDPPRDLYDPDFAVAAAQPLADRAAPVLQQILNSGVAILARCLDEAGRAEEGPVDPHLAVFIPLHHALEMLDAVNHLLRAGKEVGARAPLRSAFEAVLTIEYVLKDPKEFEERAFSYLVASVFEQFKTYDRVTPGTPEWQEMVTAAAADTLWGGGPPPSVSDAAARRSKLATILTKPKWDVAARVLTDARKKRPFAPWYSVKGGPRSIRQLAAEVGRPYQYEVLYGSLSATIHAADPYRILGKADGKLGLAMIPNWNSVKSAYSIAFSLGLSASRQVLVHYRGEKEWFAKWYNENVRAVYNELCGNSFPDV